MQFYCCGSWPEQTDCELEAVFPSSGLKLPCDNSVLISMVLFYWDKNYYISIVFFPNLGVLLYVICFTVSNVLSIPLTDQRGLMFRIIIRLLTGDVQPAIRLFSFAHPDLEFVFSVWCTTQLWTILKILACYSNRDSVFGLHFYFFTWCCGYLRLHNYKVNNIS